MSGGSREREPRLGRAVAAIIALTFLAHTSSACTFAGLVIGADYKKRTTLEPAHEPSVALVRAAEKPVRVVLLNGSELNAVLAGVSETHLHLRANGQVTKVPITSVHSIEFTEGTYWAEGLLWGFLLDVIGGVVIWTAKRAGGIGLGAR